MIKVMPKYDYILFDLDGTLSESAPGIRKSIELTLESLNKPSPDLSDYSKFIGPPLAATFSGLCGLGVEDTQKALVIYQDFYKDYGLKANRLYDGIGDLLKKLKESSAKVAVCSSKQQKPANNVCEFLGITKYFDAVCGSAPDGSRKEKEEVIPYTVNVLGGKISDKVVMIGDTKFDAKGARLNGVDFIGVNYGYGTLETMKAEGASVFADNVKELEALLFA
ncbi:MAG: HAD hydrolase-like protein [Clostridia bacterium]|nr:HAD hydrolase-like protein [Clostridia bacterium]